VVGGWGSIARVTKAQVLDELEQALIGVLELAEAAGELVVALHVAHALETIRPSGAEPDDDPEQMH
jgi:hypothetical protein